MQPNRKRLIAGAGLLVAAMVLTLLAVQRKPSSPPATAKQIVATKDIAALTRITADMVREIAVTEADPAFAAQVSEVVGRYAQRDIAKGNAIEKAAVQETNRGGRKPAPTEFRIPAGKRAVEVLVRPTSAMAVQVGDHVDVFVAYRMEGTDVVSRLVAQDLEVLHFAGKYTFYYDPPADRKAQGAEAAPPPEDKTLLILAASPADAQLISAAQERGNLIVVVRRPDDHARLRMAETWEHPRAPHRHYAAP